MKMVKRTVIQWLFLAFFTSILAGSGHAQSLNLEHSFCFPVTCHDAAITASGSVFVQIDGTCFNGLQVAAGAQIAIIIPCNMPVSLSVDAGELHIPQLDECGNYFLLGGVFAKGVADNGSGPTGTVYQDETCDGGETETSP